MTLVGLPAELAGQMRGAPRWPVLEALAPTLAYDAAVLGYGSRGGASPAGRVAAFATPTLVMNGGASPAWTRRAARQVAEVHPHGQHRSLERQTHEVAPEALAPALAASVASSRDARSGIASARHAITTNRRIRWPQSRRRRSR